MTDNMDRKSGAREPITGGQPPKQKPPPRMIEVPLELLATMLYADGMERTDAELKLRHLVDDVPAIQLPPPVEDRTITCPYCEGLLVLGDDGPYHLDPSEGMMCGGKTLLKASWWDAPDAQPAQRVQSPGDE